VATTKALELGQFGSKVNVHNENITLDGNVHGQYAGFDSDFDIAIAGKTTSNLAEGSNLYYTDARTDARVALVVDSAPSALNTLNELAAALGDDANFSTTVTNSIAAKLPLAGGTMTGNLDVGGTVTADGIINDSTQWIKFDNANTFISSATLGLLIQTPLGNNNTIFRNSSGTERMRITSSGNVGIGTSSPNALLDLEGVTASSSPILRFTGTGNASAGDVIGQIEFYNSDTTDNTAGIMGKIRAVAGSSGGEGSLQFLVDMPSEGADANNIALHLNGNSNVGIGTSSPSDKLHLQKSSDNGVVIENTTGATLSLLATGAGRVRSSGHLIFDTGGATERMRIDSSGKVGIGRTDPSQLLEVHKNAGGDQTVAKFSAHNYGDTGKTYIELGTEYGDGSSRIGSFNTSGNKSALIFEVHANTSGSFSEKMRIDDSGNVGIGTSSFGAIYDKLAVAGGINIQDDNAGKLEIGRYSSGIPNSYIKLGANSSSLRFTNNADNADLVIIENGGNVGIGTMSPAELLHLKTSSGAPVLRLEAPAGELTRIQLGDGSNYTHISSRPDMGDGLMFYENGATNTVMRSGRVGIGTTSPSYQLHVKGTGHQRVKIEKTDAGGDADISIAGPSDSIGWVLFTDSTAGSNSGAIKYVHSTNKMHFRTNDNDDQLIITSDGIVETPISVTQGGMKHDGPDPNPPAKYLGASGSSFGTSGIYRTPTITASASAVGSSQFLTIYSSGHWGEYPVFKFKVYGTYYSGGYREYVGQVAYSTASFTEVHNNSSSSFIGGGGGHTITMGNAIQVTAHAGQPRYKRDFTLTTSNTYQRCYVVVEVAYGGNRYYSSATSTATMDANGSSGGSYHFKTMSLAQGGGTFSF
jgi:hypothetical protein